MLRFEILPLEVLEKIFNLKIFESDINAIINKYYIKNNIKKELKKFNRYDENNKYIGDDLEIFKANIFGVYHYTIKDLDYYKHHYIFNSEIMIQKNILFYDFDSFNNILKYGLDVETFKFYNDDINELRFKYNRFLFFHFFHFEDYTKTQLLNILKKYCNIQFKYIYKKKKNEVIDLLYKHKYKLMKKYKKPSLEEFKEKQILY